MFSVLSALTWRPMPPAAFSRLCSKDSAWVARSAMSLVLSMSVIICVGIVCFLLFPVWSHFLSSNPSTFKVRSLGRLWTGMEWVYPLAEYLWLYIYIYIYTHTHTHTHISIVLFYNMIIYYYEYYLNRNISII